MTFPFCFSARRNSPSAFISGRSNQEPTCAFHEGSSLSRSSLTRARSSVRALAQLARDAQLEHELGDQEALLDRLVHEIVGAGAQQRRLVLRVVIAGHDQHRQLALAVAEAAADQLEQ